MTKATKARRASSPSILSILDTLLYTSPIKGVSGPKITPRSNETTTNGINNLVTLFKKVVRLASVTLKFIFSIKKLRKALAFLN